MWYRKTNSSGVCLTLARFLSLTRLQLSEMPGRVVWWLDAGDAKKPASSIKNEEVTAFHRHLSYLDDEGGKPSKTFILNYMASF
jgi:hypothetical protein